MSSYTYLFIPQSFFFTPSLSFYLYLFPIYHLIIRCYSWEANLPWYYWPALDDNDSEFPSFISSLSKAYIPRPTATLRTYLQPLSYLPPTPPVSTSNTSRTYLQPLCYLPPTPPLPTHDVSTTFFAIPA